MCQKCGCDTCETEIRGPLLTEGKVQKLISENLQYHIDKNIPLMENVFRIGSDAHLSMIKEARKLYTRNVLDLCEEDKALMETHIGEFDLYENEIVPLDLPMLEEIDEDDEYEIASRKLFDMTWDEVRRQNDQGMVQDVHDEVSKDDSDGIYFNENTEEQYPNFDLNKNIKYQDTSISSGMWRYTGKEQGGKGIYRNLNNGQILGFDRSDFDIFRKNLSSHFDIDEALNEAKKAKKKEKKDPPIGKPKRGGSKAYYVYVRSPKTKKIKKVSFGSGGLRAKIKNKKARNAFAARHNCKNKKDRTTAGYWSCNLPRYASQLGLGANQNTFW